MAPVLQSVMRDHAELSDVTAELVHSDACRWSGGVIVGAEAEALSPSSCQSRERREQLASAHTASVRDGAVRGPVDFQPRHIRSARGALGLVWRVNWIYSVWVSAIKRRVACSRVEGEGSELDAHDRIASKHIRETASIAVTRGEQTTGVDAESALHIVDEIIDEADIVQAQIRPVRVGLKP